MAAWSTLLWVLLCSWLVSACVELVGFWRPDVQRAHPGEHVFMPSWSRPRLAPQHTWVVCVSPHANPDARLDALNCFAAREDVLLSSRDADPLPSSWAVHVPSEHLAPFVQKQERFEELQNQLDEWERQTQQLQPQASSPRSPQPPAQLVSQLRQVRDDLLRHDLFLHTFLFRPDGTSQLVLDNGASVLSAVKSDPWHVRSSTRLVQRWAIPKNHTRNLLSRTTEANATSAQAPFPSRLHLVHHLRPVFDFIFVREDWAFPASKVPLDLRHRFPAPRASHAVRKAYAPLVALQDLTVRRKDWRELNVTFLTQVQQAEQTSTKRRLALRHALPTAGAGTDAGATASEAVFSTAPASFEGVSDEDAISRAAAASALASSSAQGDDAPLPPPFTPDGVTLQLSLRSCSLGWFRFAAQMEHSMNMLASMQQALELESLSSDSLRTLRSPSSLSHSSSSLASSPAVDDVKSLFSSDSSPLLLLLTFSLALVHLVLDALALKSDVSFWRRTSQSNNFKGISRASVLTSTVMRGIILLYLLDQGEGTSKIVLLSVGSSFLLQIWKSAKLLRMSVGIDLRRAPFIHVRFAPLPASESTSNALDRQALRWLGLLALPFVLGAAAWSLAYDAHRSWYSWVVSSLATAVYTGGFVLMTPQLFLNYRLKSVSALPLRAFVYRACATVLDDLFAFLFPMPTAHRIACFRDDIVFLVFLYQRWIYPVDHARGVAQIGEDDEEGKEENEPAQALAQPDTTTNGPVVVDSAERAGQDRVDGDEGGKKAVPFAIEQPADGAASPQPAESKPVEDPPDGNELRRRHPAVTEENASS